MSTFDAKKYYFWGIFFKVCQIGISLILDFLNKIDALMTKNTTGYFILLLE